MRQLKRKVLKLFGFGFLSLIIGLFLFQFNSFVSANYQFQQCEETIQSIALENQTLGAGLVEKDHFDQIEILARAASFEKTDQVRFIEITPAMVAAK